MQLGLFGENAPIAPPLRRRRSATRPPAVSVQSQSVLQSNQDVLAAVTEFFYDAEESDETVNRAFGLLAHQTEGDLRNAAVGAAWMLAVCLQTMESQHPGTGLALLRSLGTALARRQV